LTVRRYAERGRWWVKAPPMTPTEPVVALAVLSLIAKEREYDMTGTGLMVLTGVLATWGAALFFKFG